MGPLSCHRNIIVTLIIEEVCRCFTNSCISLFLKKKFTGLTKMTTVLCFRCLLEVSLSTLTNVKALMKHKLTSTQRPSFFHINCTVTRNAFVKEYQISSKLGVQVAKEFCKLKLNQLKNFFYVKQTKNNSFFSVNMKNDFFARA